MHHTHLHIFILINIMGYFNRIPLMFCHLCDVWQHQMGVTCIIYQNSDLESEIIKLIQRVWKKAMERTPYLFVVCYNHRSVKCLRIDGSKVIVNLLLPSLTLRSMRYVSHNYSKLFRLHIRRLKSFSSQA